jgi:hypothetical protein
VIERLGRQDYLFDYEAEAVDWVNAKVIPPKGISSLEIKHPAARNPEHSKSGTPRQRGRRGLVT